MAKVFTKIMTRAVLTLLLMVSATTAWADKSGSCGTGVTYKYVSSSQTIIISGKGAMRDYSGIEEERPWEIVTWRMGNESN